MLPTPQYEFKLILRENFLIKMSFQTYFDQFLYTGFLVSKLLQTRFWSQTLTEIIKRFVTGTPSHHPIEQLPQ